MCLHSSFYFSKYLNILHNCFFLLRYVWIWGASELPWKNWDPNLFFKNIKICSSLSFCSGCLLQRWGWPCGKQVQEEEFHFYSWRMSGFEKPASSDDNWDPNLLKKKMLIPFLLLGCLLQRWGGPCGKQVHEEELNFYSWKMSGFEKPASCHENPNLF